MSRSIWKGPYLDNLLYVQLLNGHKNIYTNSRTSTITELCIGKIINVHNGMSYFKVNVNESMIGRKLGEFILTKKKVVFKKKKNKK